MHEVGQQWKKKRQKISRFYKEGTKVQKGLMYKTKVTQNIHIHTQIKIKYKKIKSINIRVCNSI